MDYPHLVTPQKIRLSRDVELVPQLGHRAGIRALVFDPATGLLAALDESPTVQVWSTDQGEVLQILPVPIAACDDIRWLPDQVLAVRQCPENDEDPPVWWVRATGPGERWRPAEAPTPPAGVYRLDGLGKKLKVKPPKGRAVTLKKAPVSSVAVLDPLGRYVLLGHETNIHVYDAVTGERMHTLEGHDAEVVSIALTSRGDHFYSCDVAGHVLHADPMRDTTLRQLTTLKEHTTTMILDLADEHAAIGDASGHINLISLRSGRRMMRTPRRVPSFDWEVLLAEQVGYFGARFENFGGYIDGSLEIIPMRPLPGRATAVSASLDFPRVVVALEAGQVVELELGNETVERLAEVPFPLRLVALSDYGVLGIGSDGVFWHDGDAHFVWADEDLAATKALAIARNGEHTAFALDNTVSIHKPRGEKITTVAVPRAKLLAFTQYRDRPVLVIVDEGGVLWRWDVERDRLTRVGVVASEDIGNIGEIIAITVDEDGSVRIMSRGDHAHRLLLMLDLASAGATLLGGVVVFGHQVVAVYDDDGTWLRQDEERSVRMVRDLVAFEPTEWSRLPEPG